MAVENYQYYVAPDMKLGFYVVDTEKFKHLDQLAVVIFNESSRTAARIDRDMLELYTPVSHAPEWAL